MVLGADVMARLGFLLDQVAFAIGGEKVVLRCGTETAAYVIINAETTLIAHSQVITKA